MLSLGIIQQNFRRGLLCLMTTKQISSRKGFRGFSDALVRKCCLMLMKRKKKSCTNEQMKGITDYSDISRICVLRSGLDGRGTADCILRSLGQLLRLCF